MGPVCLTTRKTSGRLILGGRSGWYRTGTVGKPASLASQGVSQASRLPEDAVPFTVVPVMVPMTCLPFILWSIGRVGD
jgi:hypothetical protein